MKTYYKILMINLIIGLSGILPVVATEDGKRKLPDEFCQSDSDHTKRQRTQEGGGNPELAHFDNGTPLPDDKYEDAKVKQELAHFDNGTPLPDDKYEDAKVKQELAPYDNGAPLPDDKYEDAKINQELGPFDNGIPLPDDQWVNIFTYLERNDIVQMSQVCQSCYNLTTNYWLNTVIDMSSELTYVHDLLELFPNPNPYSIKVRLSEGESANFHLLQSFRQVRLIIEKYDYKDYQNRYLELSNRMLETKEKSSFLKIDRESFDKRDWSINDKLIGKTTTYYLSYGSKSNGTLVRNPTYNNRDFITILQLQMMQVNHILMQSNTLPGCFNPYPIPHLANLAHNLTFLEYKTPCQTCTCDRDPCMCNPIAKFDSIFDLYSFDLYSEFSHISNLSSLRSLILTSDSIHPPDIQFISTLTNLTYLDMSNECEPHQDPRKIAKPFQPFSTLTNLTYLNLSDYNSCSLAGIDSLSALTSLTELNLQSAIENARHCTQVDGTDLLNISFLGNLKNLANLNLSYIACNLMSLEALSGLGQLNKLDLTHMVLDDIDEKKVLASLSTFTTLEHLYLTYFPSPPVNNNGSIIDYEETNMSIEKFQNKYGIQHMDPYIVKTDDGKTLFLKKDLIEYFLPLKNLKTLEW